MAKPIALQLPPPRHAETKRTRRVLVVLTVPEHEGLKALAAQRNEAVATVARVLIVSALRAVCGTP